MTPQEKKNIQLHYQSQIQELNRLVRNWDLIPSTPLDTFEHLTNQILSQLSKGADRDKIQRVIQSELITRYGIDVNSKEAILFAEDIYDWWVNRQ